MGFLGGVPNELRVVKTRKQAEEWTVYYYGTALRKKELTATVRTYVSSAVSCNITEFLENLGFTYSVRDSSSTDTLAGLNLITLRKDDNICT